MQSVKKGLTNGEMCQVYGLICFTKCAIFNACVIYFPQQGNQLNQFYFTRYYNESFFSLTRNNHKMLGLKHRKLVLLSQRAIQGNAMHIKNLRSKEYK